MKQLKRERSGATVVRYFALTMPDDLPPSVRAIILQGEISWLHSSYTRTQVRQMLKGKVGLILIGDAVVAYDGTLSPFYANVAINLVRHREITLRQVTTCVGDIPCSELWELLPPNNTPTQ